MWLQATVRDLYAKKDLGLFTHNFTWIVPQHGVLAIKLTPSKCVPSPYTEHPAWHSPRPCMAAGHTALLPANCANLWIWQNCMPDASTCANADGCMLP